MDERRKPNNWPEKCTYRAYSVADDCKCKDCVRRREMLAMVPSPPDSIEDGR